VDLIARIHAGFEAERVLADCLDGRTVAVRGLTGDEAVTVERQLEACGAEIGRMVGPETWALVAGSQATSEDHVAASNRALAILTPDDVALIHTAMQRVRRLDERAFRAAVDRALADARRAVSDREKRHLRPVSNGDRYGGMHIHS
jgi:hypothetical protein